MLSVRTNLQGCLSVGSRKLKRLSVQTMIVIILNDEFNLKNNSDILHNCM